MAARSKIFPKMRHCACTLVSSSRSVKFDHVSRYALPLATTSGLFHFPGPFQRTSWHFKNSIGYYVL